MGRIRDQHVALVKMIKSGACTDCGHRYHPEVMDLDHVRGVKVAAISDLVRGKTERLLEELSKVELVCANCHRLRGLKRRKKGAK